MAKCNHPSIPTVLTKKTRFIFILNADFVLRAVNYCVDFALILAANW